MAVKRDFLTKVLPFPENIPMHDQWMGLIAEKKGSVAFLNTPLIKYRRHSDNVSSLHHSRLSHMVKFRANLISALLSK